MNSIEISYAEELPSLPNKLESKIVTQLPELVSMLGQKDRLLSLYFCGLEEMQTLNSEYRGKNRPTDILSWIHDDEEMMLPEEEKMPWGDLVICLPVCEEQAEKSDWDLEVELFRLLVHGLVHLAGYDHEISEAEEKRMLAVEMTLLRKLGLEFVYQD